MSDKKVFLYACEVIGAEIKDAVDEMNLENIDVQLYSCPLFHQNAIEKIEDIITKPKSNFLMITSEKCLQALGIKDKFDNSQDNIKIIDHCFQLFLPKKLFKHMSEENYIVNHRLLSMIFNKLKKNEFTLSSLLKYTNYKEKILLIDTFSGNGNKMYLKNLHTKFSIDYDILPVGLDLLKLYLNNFLTNYEIQKERNQSLRRIAEANRYSAKYEMAFELINQLTSLRNEEEVQNQILFIYKSLFRPKKIISLFYEEDKSVSINSASKEIDQKLERFQEFNLENKDYLMLKKENGFLIKISQDDETLGIIELKKIEFEQYLERYLNIAIIVSKVAGLAISNARKFERLNLALQKLKRSNKELKQFSSVVSHDLKQPLSTIIGYLNFLEEIIIKDLDQSPEDIIDEALNVAKDMNKMIKAILDYSRIERVNLSMENLDLNMILSKVKRNLTSKINKTDSIIRYEKLPEVYADEVQMIQLFQNLLDNAMKYKDKKPIITIKASSTNGNWVIRVIDNGMEIPESKLDSIFKPFYRANKSKKISGSGVGLSICKKIIEIHGGRIWVELNKKGGSTFKFILPKSKK